jgi:hypothetical protein
VPSKFYIFGDGGICRYIENLKVLPCKSTKCGKLVFIYTIFSGDGKLYFEE